MDKVRRYFSRKCDRLFRRNESQSKQGDALSRKTKRVYYFVDAYDEHPEIAKEVKDTERTMNSSYQWLKEYEKRNKYIEQGVINHYSFFYSQAQSLLKKIFNCHEDQQQEYLALYKSVVGELVEIQRKEQQIEQRVAEHNQISEKQIWKGFEGLSLAEREKKIENELQEQERLIGNYVEYGADFEDFEIFAHKHIGHSKCKFDIIDENYRSLSFGRAWTLKEHTYFLRLRLLEAEDNAALAECEKYRKYLVLIFSREFHNNGFLIHEPTGSRYFFGVGESDEDEDDLIDMDENDEGNFEATGDPTYEAVKKVVESYLAKNGVHREKKIDNPDAHSVAVEMTEGLSIDF